MTSHPSTKPSPPKSSLSSLEEIEACGSLPHKYSDGSLNAIGILETLGWTAAMVAVDQMCKTADVHVLQAEWNDMLGSVIKIHGGTSDVEAALQAGATAARSFSRTHPMGEQLAT